MKEYFIKNKVNLILIAVLGLFYIISVVANFGFGIKTMGNFTDSFIEMITLIPFMFVLIGLFDVWVPKEVIEKHVGQDSGIKGMLWVILLSMLQGGPLYGAFPVAYILWKKGASTRNIFVYLGAFSTMKIPMLSFEIGYLGLKFSLMRTLLTLPVFILTAILMEKIFGKNFKMKQPESDKKD
ncbi:MAG: hypothetical protein HPY53_12730 [Brevinematales bacterium]|nr:hypothetical protein [Brevinematales bacterium]